jgi:hypothetical protein
VDAQRDQRHGENGAVEDGARVERREDRQRNREREPQQRSAGDHRRGDREELEHDVGQVAPVVGLAERAVEEDAAHVVPVGGRRRGAGRRRVDGDHLEDEERQHGHGDERDQRERDPLDEIGDHRARGIVRFGI